MEQTANTIKFGSRLGATWGIFVILLGILSIAIPWLTGLGVTMTLGIILIATGIAQFFYVFKSDSFGSGALRFIFSLLAAVTGIAILVMPGEGLAGITLFLAAWFIVDGVWSLISGIRWRPFEGWGMMVFSGITSIVLGGLVYYQFPTSSIWLLGMLIGVRLIFAGWAMIAMAAVSEKIVDEVLSSIDQSDVVA